MKIFKKMKKGFTLVELVVVIAVIAILAAVSVGAYFGVTESANNSKLEQEAKQVHTAIQTVALAPNEHSSLTSNGLTITDAGKFELALEENLGIDVALTDVQDIKDSSKPTIYFFSSSVNPAFDGSTLYKGFEYFNNSIGGKRAVADVVTGEIDIVNKAETSKEILDNDKSFNLVTTANEISVGDKIVVVSTEHEVALSTTQNNNNRGEATVVKEEGKVFINDDVQIITLEAGAVEGTYAFKTETGYLYAASNSSNHLKTKANLDENGSWLITVDEGEANVVAQGDNKCNILQYNVSSKLFSCYEVSNQTDIAIYRFGTYVPCEHDFGDNLDKCANCGAENPNYVPPQPQLFTKTVGEAVAIANELDSNETTYDFYEVTGTVNRIEGNSPKVYLTDGENSIQVYKKDSTFENLYQGYTATVKGKIMNYLGTTPEIYDYEYVSHIPVNYSITIPTFENGSVTASQITDIPHNTAVTFTITPNAGYELSVFTVNDTAVEVENNTLEYTITRDVTVNAVFTEVVSDTDTATYKFSEGGHLNQETITSISFTDAISASFDKGTNQNPPKYFTSGTALRIYPNNKMTINNVSGTITKIVIVFGEEDGTNTISTDVGTYTNGTWTGNSSTVVFTIGGSNGNRRISSIEVTYIHDDSVVYLSSISANPESLEFDEKDQEKSVSITAVYSDNSTVAIESSVVEWKSNDSSVVTVLSGTIKSIKSGNTTITATYGGKKVNIGITVNIPAEPGAAQTVTFEFGANGAASHVDGNSLGASKSYTEGDYTLSLTNMTSVYGPAYDATGKSCIKLGTSKVIGTFNLEVPSDVKKVSFEVATYKAENSVKLNIAGTNYTVSTTSNDSAYTTITVDAASTITFKTVATSYRCMINSITFIF